MKKIFLAIIFLTLVSALPVSAKTLEWSNPQGNKPSSGTEVQNRIENRKNENIPTLQAEKRLELREQKKKNIQTYFTQMTKRLELLISRLETLTARIESRIAKLEAGGQNLTEEKNQINLAKTKLDKARSDLNSANSKLEEILTGNNPKQAFAEVRTLIKDLKTQLKEVHQILVHVIGNIKGLRIGSEKITPKVSPKPTESKLND